MLYLYAIVDRRPRRLAVARMPGRRLRLVKCGRVYAAVDERPVTPEPTPAALRAHDRVVRALAAAAPAVAPARFGLAAADEKALGRLLYGRAGAIRRVLRQIHGCEQMTLRLFQPDRIETAAGSRRARRREPDGGGPGTRYLMARRASSAALRETLDGLRRTFRFSVIAERVELRPAGALVATVHHLVRRGRGRSYRAAARRFAHTHRALRLRFSGPMPCYAFAGDVRLRP